MISKNLARLAILSCLSLAGCAGFASTPIAPLGGAETPKSASDGIYYYMPIAPIVVQVQLDQNSNETVTVPTISAYPDRSKPFLLTAPDNLISENHAVLSVGANGLLQSAGTTETSGVDTIVKSVASDLGTITSFVGRAPALAPSCQAPPPVTCQKSTTYSLIIYPENIDQNPQLCGFSVKITKIEANSPISTSSRATDYGAQQSGIFYKTEVPYMVTVTASGAPDAQNFIAYSPNEAPIQFAPLRKTIFANNTTTISLTDGVLTKSDSDVGGEITGLVALPADAIGAYMTAIGNVFSSLQTNSSNASSAALANAQWQLCKAALAANAVQGVSAAQAATNYAAIKAACGG